MGIQGSAVSGRSYETGAIFDSGRVSDLDIAINDQSLFEKARVIGVETRGSGMQTAPLSASQIERLGLSKLQGKLSNMAGRPVEFMIFGDRASVVSKGPTIWMY